MNGGAKGQGRYFNGAVPILQLGLAPIIMRVCFLMQIFRPRYIQGNHVDDKSDLYYNQKQSDDIEDDDDSAVGRPSRAEICWYGATDDGLIDVRPHVHLWGSQKEIHRFHELKVMECNKNLTPTEIAEIALQENWHAKLL
jgi:hypothetical protein